MNCYILTGGRSTRMGRSKSALFFERVAAAARPVFDEVIELDRAEGEQAPIYGVARALRDAQRYAFLLAVDYPLITSDVLRFLRDRRGVAMWDGEPQLLCAVWDTALLPEVEQRIAAERFDLRGLNERDIIPESELRARFGGEPLRNVNTPEQLAEAERWYGG
jgi:molybdopterin-guanine dinucleotide biosynthesis protein A